MKRNESSIAENLRKATARRDKRRKAAKEVREADVSKEREQHESA